RRPRRPRDAALRLPAARPGARARGRPARRSPRPAPCGGADGAPRPPRPRLHEGRGRRPRAAVAPRLVGAAERRVRRRAAPDETMSLQGSSVLVTGGTRGIGLAIAHRLVRDGAGRVVLGYLRNDAAAESAAAELGIAGVTVDLVRGNVASESTVEKLAAAGPYRVVVHNAATGVVRPALETEDKHWDWTINANARSLLQLARVAAPQMPDGSSIVSISSL